MNVRQLAVIVRNALAYVGDGLPGFESDGAVQMVMGTAAHESHFADFAQLGGGPALGLWQIEPEDADDIHKNFLVYHPDLSRRVADLVASWPSIEQQLASNIAYGAVICRLTYWRHPNPLPAPGDLTGQASLWKVAYNTALGAGSPAEFIADYRTYIGDAL